jgi:hypothetical protein
MPYIDPKYRKRLDPLIDKLADEVVHEARQEKYDAAFTGLLNYVYTRLVLKIVKRLFGKVRYWVIAAVSGVFKNASDEWYRRVGAPYEDRKIKSEGDLPLFHEMDERKRK